MLCSICFIFSPVTQIEMAMQYLWRRDIVSRTSKTWGFYTKKMLSIASVSSYTGARSSQYPLSIPCWQFFLFIKLHRIIKLRPCVPPLNKLCQILQMCKVQLRRPEAGVILLASVKQCHCTHKNFISSKWNLNLLAKRYTCGQKKGIFPTKIDICQTEGLWETLRIAKTHFKNP